jgi:hypothetical protein
MSKGVPGWVKGCAVGCGAVVVLLVVLLVLGFYFVRGTFEEFEQADATIGTVEERFGTVESFLPEPGGTVIPDRIEAFLEVREIAAPSRAGLAGNLDAFSEEKGRIGKLTGVFTLPGRLSSFMSKHHEALLQVGMGQGEYHYIYVLAYYSFLGKSPADGPAFSYVGANGYALEKIESIEESTVRERREETVRRGVNHLVLHALKNRLDQPPADANLRSTLEAEIALLEAEPLRLPWEDGLPESLEAAFLPYRERLEESYDPATSVLEVGIPRR